MPAYNSIAVGNQELSLDSVSTAVAGTPFYLHKVRPSGMIRWTYEPGATKPTAIVVVCEISADNTNWRVIDSWNDPTKPVSRMVAAEARAWVRLRVATITIGSGNPLSGKIIV